MRKRFRSMGVLIAAGLLLFLVIAVDVYFYTSPFKPQRKTSLAKEGLPPPGSRILVVAPHCDDETLGPGILLHRALDAGRKVKVVLVTNGDGFTLAVNEDFFTLHPSSKEYRELGYQRQQESVRALKKLGLAESDIIFLGYPDAGVARLWTEYWDRDKRYFSRYTQTDVSPYRDSFDKNTPYTGENLLEDLAKVIDDYQPTHIYYPHPNDRHPDHWGSNAFVKYLLEKKKLWTVQEVLYLVHRGNWPTPRLPRPAQKLYPPSILMGTGTDWQQFPFAAGEARLKEAAIVKYTTQMRAMGSFLLAFVRSSELFGRYPDFVIPRLGAAGLLTDKKATAIQDPVRDFVTRDVDRTADIKDVLSYIKNDSWVLEIKTAAPVSSTVTYRLHGRMFPEKGDPGRFDLNYTGGKVTFKRYARNSLVSLSGITAGEVRGRLQVRIPLKHVRDTRAVFLSADSAVGTYTVDKTAWRMLRFK